MGNVLSKHGKLVTFCSCITVYEYEQTDVEGLWPSQHYIDQQRFRERIINCELLLEATLLKKQSLYLQ